MATKNPSCARFTRPTFERASALPALDNAPPNSRRFRALISTEAPVDRLIFYGGQVREAREILIHGQGTPNLSRLGTSAGIPVLRGHDGRTQIGQVRAPSVMDGKLYAELEIFSDTPDGREVISQFDNGYGLGVSVGYDIRATEIDELEEVDEVTGDNVLELNVREWDVVEASVVSVPADLSAGVIRDALATRAFRDATQVLDLGGAAHKGKRETKNMKADDDQGAPPKDAPPPPADAGAEATRNAGGTPTPLTPPTIAPEVRTARDAEEAAASARVAEGARVKMHADSQVRSKLASKMEADFALSSPEVRAAVAKRAKEFFDNPHDIEVDAIRACHKLQGDILGANTRASAELANHEGLNAADFTRALMSEDKNTEARQFSEQMLRGSLGESLSRKLNGNQRSILLPIDIAMGRHIPGCRAAFTGVDTTGVPGVTAGTGNADTNAAYADYREDWFVNALRPDLVLGQVGVSRELTNNDLVYSIQGGVATAGFVGETDPLPDTSWTYTTRTTSPHRYGTRIVWTRLREMQDRISLTRQIANELAASTAQTYEMAVLTGSGADDEPQGILGTTGVGSYNFGGTGVGGAISKEHLLKMDLDRRVANMSDQASILTTPHVATQAQLTPLGTLNAPSEATLASTPIGAGRTMLSFPYVTSNLMPRDKTKGTGADEITGLHTLLFGNFSSIVVIDYGIVEITFDDLTMAKNNMFQLTYNAWMDVEIRRPSALTAVEDIQI